MQFSCSDSPSLPVIWASIVEPIKLKSSQITQKNTFAKIVPNICPRNCKKKGVSVRVVRHSFTMKLVLLSIDCWLPRRESFLSASDFKSVVVTPFDKGFRRSTLSKDHWIRELT